MLQQLYVTGVSKLVTIRGTGHFQAVCQALLLKWYEKNYPGTHITADNVFTVWLSKNLQNYKCLVSSNLLDGIYAEYTYNGDKMEIYEDVYKKLTNKKVTEI